MAQLFALLLRLVVEGSRQRPFLTTVLKLGFELAEQATFLLKLIAENLLVCVELTVLSLEVNSELRKRTNLIRSKVTLIFPTRCHVLVSSRLTVLSRFSCLSSRCSKCEYNVFNRVVSF